jgi:hypothetical protein
VPFGGGTEERASFTNGATGGDQINPSFVNLTLGKPDGAFAASVPLPPLPLPLRSAAFAIGKHRDSEAEIHFTWNGAE